MSYSPDTKVLFVHDGPIYKDDQNHYYGIHLTDTLRERYLQLGTKVTFLMRVEKVDMQQKEKLSRISDENFSVIEVPNFKSFSKYFSTKGEARAIIEKAVDDHDVIVTRLPSGSGNMAAKYAAKIKKPLLAEMVACTLDAYWYHSTKGKLIAHYSFFKQKRIMKKLDYCIYVTKHFLQDRYPIKGKWIGCSDVEIKAISEEVLEKRRERIANTDTKKLVIGSIGTLNMSYKGHDDVIKAVAILKKKGFNFVYKLIGQGDTSRLERIIKENGVENEVDIVGPIKHSAVFELIDTLDIYIHPSRTEGLPRAPIEAMSRACPVMGSDAGGTPELISSEFTFRKGNIDQIVSMLSSVTKESLYRESERSLEQAREYQREVLDKKRSDFYTMFLSETLK